MMKESISDAVLLVDDVLMYIMSFLPPNTKYLLVNSQWYELYSKVLRKKMLYLNIGYHIMMYDIDRLEEYIKKPIFKADIKQNKKKYLEKLKNCETTVEKQVMIKWLESLL